MYMNNARDKILTNNGSFKDGIEIQTKYVVTLSGVARNLAWGVQLDIFG